MYSWTWEPSVLIGLALQAGAYLACVGPLVAFMAFNFTFAIWHVPAYYERALHDQTIHILEHVTFFVTATLTWWPIFSRSMNCLRCRHRPNASICLANCCHQRSWAR